MPANHIIIDQVIYDLPLQTRVHESWRKGELSWWDPYNYCGRPLQADAHINATDPIRLAFYSCLPFEAAYNWTRVAHFVLCGLGMLWLLRSLGVGESPALWLALAYELGGGFTLLFGHPWVQASFIYYPFLWLAWTHATAGRLGAWAGASLLVAGVFYAGNIQSHAYLVVFALAFCAGQAGKSCPRWRANLTAVGITGLVGALLAAPVLGTELELFRLSQRQVGGEFAWSSCLSGLASLTAFYPWCLGTFKSVDASKLIGSYPGMGFTVFIGCAASVLAVVGGATRPPDEPRQAARRVALWLCLLYGLILSTPLNQFFYTRSGPLALLGLVVLAALGFEALCADPQAWPRLARAVAVLAVITVLCLNVFAFVVFPRISSRLEQVVQGRTSNSRNFVEATALRRAQVARLPGEMSLRNPEALLGFVGLVVVAGLLARPALRKNPWMLHGLLLLNFLPLLIFSARFVPRHPIEQWRALVRGGPEHQQAIAQLANGPRRLAEQTTSANHRLFPGATAALYGVRVVHGYAALWPRTLDWIVPPADDQAADWSYETSATEPARGVWQRATSNQFARFVWQGPAARSFEVQDIGPHRIKLTFAPGPAGSMIWKDTHYPGWNLDEGGRSSPVRAAGACWSEFDVPVSATEVVLRYRPAYLSATLVLTGTGFFVSVLFFLAGPLRQVWRSRSLSQISPPRAG